MATTLSGTILTVAILALATARLAILLVVDDGPFMLFYKLRRELGIFYDENSQRVVYHENPFWRTLAEIFNCTNCMSLWVSTLVVVGYLIWGVPFVIVLLPLAISMGAMILVRLSDG